MPADEFVWEPGDQAKLELLCPKFAGLVTQLGEMMNLAGQPVRIIDAVRSWKRHSIRLQVVARIGLIGLRRLLISHFRIVVERVDIPFAFRSFCWSANHR